MIRFPRTKGHRIGGPHTLNGEGEGGENLGVPTSSQQIEAGVQDEKLTSQNSIFGNILKLK